MNALCIRAQMAKEAGEAGRENRVAMLTRDARARLAAQIPDQEKAGRCDYVIDNTGPLDETRRAWWERIYRRAGAARRSDDATQDCPFKPAVERFRTAFLGLKFRNTSAYEWASDPNTPLTGAAGWNGPPSERLAVCNENDLMD